MPRLFAALELPHLAVTQLSMLRGGLPGARFIDVENYHLTLRFMGDVENHVADEIAASLDRIKPRSIDITIDGLGVFGGKKPRAIYAAIAPCEPLHALHEEIDFMCQKLGLAPDSRKFTPHITLARLKNVSPESTAKFIADRGGFFVPSFAAKEFALMSSRDSVGGGPYICEERYALTTNNSEHASMSLANA